MITNPDIAAVRRRRQSFGRGPTPIVQGVAWIAMLTVVMLAILAASPEAHTWLHPDAGHANHSCGVTLAQLGFCDTAAAPPIPSAPDLFLVVVPARSQSHEWSAPDYWHVPGQAPPSGRSQSV